MISFASDYIEGCHPRILRRLVESNEEQCSGYGLDPYCAEAAECLRALLECPDGDVHFLVGGTQTNTLAIASALRPHEGVIAAESGHINVHESGAIEASGHKVIALPAAQGKLEAERIEAYLKWWRADDSREHIVKPAMIYLSQTTELGTVYRKDELQSIRELADRFDLYVYMDGARLASGMAVSATALTYADLPRLFDSFSLGGTKAGLLFGEALVLVNDRLKPDFRSIQKQRGGMLAKGRLLGVQFLELFRDGLFDEIGRHENRLAMRMADGLAELGLSFAAEPCSNQLFVYLPEGWEGRLAEDFVFESMSDAKGRRMIRLCTSWASSDAQIEAFLACASELRQSL